MSDPMHRDETRLSRRRLLQHAGGALGENPLSTDGVNAKARALMALLVEG